MGRKISITYEANIGMVLNVKPEIGRCGYEYAIGLQLRLESTPLQWFIDQPQHEQS